MSGGSYDYFYSRVTETLRNIESTLDSMSAQCTEKIERYESRSLLSDKDLALLEECAIHLRIIAGRIETAANMTEKISEILYRIEWWKSGDSGPEEVIEEWKKYKASF